MKLLLLIAALISLSSCASIENLGQALGGGGVEPVDGKYYIELTYFVESRTKHHFKGKSPAQVMKNLSDNAFLREQPKYLPRGRAQAYYYCLDSPRFVRYVQLHTAAPIKNIDVYVWEGENWVIVRQLAKPISAKTRIGINRRTSAIRVVQKTVNLGRKPMDRITDFDVYVQKK